MRRFLKDDWQELLEDETKKDYYQRMRRFLIEYRTRTIYQTCMIYSMPYI